MQNRRKIRNYFPEPKFQFRFLRFLFLASSFQIIATFITLYLFFNSSFRVIMNRLNLSDELQLFLKSETNNLFLFVGGTFVFYLITIMLIGIVFSQRLGGFLFALKRTIREINQGKNIFLKLRAGDDQDDLVDEFNKMLVKFRRLDPLTEKKAS